MALADNVHVARFNNGTWSVTARLRRYDLIRQLRLRASHRGGRIPAIAVTAYASVADRATALESGFQAHIAKPFDPAQLARIVASVRRERLSTS